MGIFGSSVNFNPETDIKDLAGKVILVTGANTGLGKETVLQLAKHHPHKLFLAARTESKAKAAIDDLNKQLKEPVDIEWLPLDLASLSSVKAAAETVNAKTDRLDILVLNAGIMAVPPGKTDAGFDIQLGTNHVGHFLLTQLLLPTLQKTAALEGSDVRVVSLSSDGHNFGPWSIDTIVDTDKLTATSPWVRYGASKTANILFAAELARRYPTVTSTSVHPGIIVTNLYSTSQKSSSPISILFNAVAPWISTDVPHGTLNQLYLAAGATKDQITNGGYYTPVGKLQARNKWAKDVSAGQRLWEWTESELKKLGY
ncbi:hypothetical protein DV736_g156, partial [Chaetothyriales sp. CBS 134916]